MKRALEARGIGVSLGGTPVLHGIGLSLPAARWTSVVGPNGAGKSTLLKALAGLLPCTGEVQWFGRPLAQWRGRERARQLAIATEDKDAGHRNPRRFNAPCDSIGRHQAS